METPLKLVNPNRGDGGAKRAGQKGQVSLQS